jgi:hypothetical protein
LALKRADTESFSQEQCIGILKRAGSGIVEIKAKLLSCREGAFFVPSGFAVEASMTSSGRNLLPVYVIGMELSLCCYPCIRSHGQDPVLKLDTVTQIYTVLGHS